MGWVFGMGIRTWKVMEWALGIGRREEERVGEAPFALLVE